MILRHKVKRDGNKLVLETCVEYDDGTRHPRIGTLEIMSGYNLNIKEWELLQEWFDRKAEQLDLHMIVDLGPKND